MHLVQREYLFIISSYSEENASELLENLEDMFPRH